MRLSVRAAAVVAMVILASGLITGCSLADELFGNGEKAEALDGDTICTVGGEKVSLSEWFLYALPMRARTESSYGRRIWEVAIRGEAKDIGEAVKNEIFDSIVFVKTVAGRAKSLGVALTEDDRLEIERSTDEYLEELREAGKDDLGITRETVEKVFSDNLLAQRVYERITLNVDTYIPEDEVRHMTLEYATISKFYENGNGEMIAYTEDELESLRGAARECVQNIRVSEEYKTLRSSDNDKLIPMTITADYDTVKERLSEELADIAFAMNDGEVTDLIENDDVILVLGCVARTDVRATNEAKVAEIERRQQKAFEEAYNEWKDETVVRINYVTWDAVSIE